MCKNLLNRVRNIFAAEEYTERSTNVVSIEKINVGVDLEDCTEKNFNSLVKNLEDSLFNDCCMVCASKIIQRFFPETDDMTRRALTKIYGITGIDPAECSADGKNPHGWVWAYEIEFNQREQRIIVYWEHRYFKDEFRSLFGGWGTPDIKVELWEPYSFHTPYGLYLIFKKQMEILQKIITITNNDIKKRLLNKMDYLSSTIMLHDAGLETLLIKMDLISTIMLHDAIARRKSMRVKFPWVSYKIIEIMLNVEKFSELRASLGGNATEQFRILHSIFNEYLNYMEIPMTENMEGYNFIDYVATTQSELNKKYSLEGILNLESRYASNDEIIQFIKCKSGDIYTCDGHEATMGLYKIPFNRLDNKSNDRGEAFEHVVLEFFRIYLNPDCANSFYIKKKNDNETDIIAWGSGERVMILGECKINQRYSNLKISAERFIGSVGYKSVAQLKKRMELIKNGEQLKPVNSGNYSIPNDLKEYEVISLSIHASEYIFPMYLEGVHVISLESLVMVLRSVDGIKEFKKYMSFRKECIENGEKKFDEFDILYSYYKGNVKPEDLENYECDSVWMPFDISDIEWREFVNGRGEYRNLVRLI